MTARRIIETRCCVVGGGPSGMMAGLLFARAGVETLVLEKHGDFLRDFRGDTVHPSTIEIMRELGFAEDFLKRPHQELKQVSGVFGTERVRVADFSRLPIKTKFIALMPQWHFLDFLADRARELPAFNLMMNCEAVDLVEENGRVAGVVAKTEGEELEIRASLVIAADGRRSRVRERAGLRVTDLGAPIDVFWFRVPREEGADDTLLYAGAENVVVTIDRGDYWQCAYVIPKGAAETVRERGLEAFRESAARTAPPLRSHIEAVQDWEQVKLLTVAVDRLETWSRPGLLMIGDSAHAMSPIGGVGINLAIQDAVAAANLFAGPLTNNTLRDEDLKKLQQRRLLPTRFVQFVQRIIQNGILHPIVAGRTGPPSPPLLLRLTDRFAFMRGITARLLGLGIRREHVRSPASPLVRSDRQGTIRHFD